MLAARFFILFLLALLLPHVEGWQRWVWLAAFGLSLYGLLWHDLRREED